MFPFQLQKWQQLSTYNINVLSNEEMNLNIIRLRSLLYFLKANLKLVNFDNLGVKATTVVSLTNVYMKL